MSATCASVGSAKPPVCAGSTKKAAIKQIKTAYDYFLDGAAHPTAEEKAPYIQYLSGPKFSQEFLDKFKAQAAANAGDAGSTNVQVNKVTCTGKKSATVDYDLVLGGSPSPGLAPGGAAILEGKTWKVTGLTVCNLQQLGDPTTLETEPCATILTTEKA